MARKFSELLNQMSPESREMIEREVKKELKRLSPLAEIRRSRNISQQELAEAMGVSQPNIANMEKRADMYISSLRGYIEGLGGTLEIVVRFPDKEVKIKDFSEAELETV